jgi:hypothetical protein
VRAARPTTGREGVRGGQAGLKPQGPRRLMTPRVRCWRGWRRPGTA